MVAFLNKMSLLRKVLKKLYYKLFFYKKFFYSTFISFIGILLGFFSANTLSTILGQTGDWGILSSGVLVAFVESTNRIVYTNKKNLKMTLKTFHFFLMYTITEIFLLFEHVAMFLHDS